ncbi:cyclic nucleotide-binding domain-containing protein [Granulosicoccaceae sp. 1_MG-2023]|nr:cyclic nucleotide-binding domain-containing protein [Granulosicoccaceae sp. 1_MG-2023]
MTTEKPEPRLRVIASGARTDCDQCEARDRCPGAGLNDEQLKALAAISTTRGPYKPGEAIYRMEDRFHSLFVVQTGAVKVESVSDEGDALVDGFYFSGEMFGVDAIGDSRYRNDAVAMESTWVCELPYDKLEHLCGQIPELQHKIFKLLGHQIRQINNNLVHNRGLPAEKRVMMFLQTLSESNVIRRNEAGRFRLPISKGDIACYLGLRPESLSRALSKLAAEGVIRNNAKLIELVESETAFELAYK